MKNQITERVIPVVAAALLLTILAGCTSVGTDSSQSYQPQQQTYSPPPQPSLASTLVGTWKSSDDSLVIRQDLTATWLGDDGHIEVVSGDHFHLVYGDQKYSDWKVIDNNTISHTENMFGDIEVKYSRQ
jgi:hypothetical protein